jgi:hypothetical protein
MLSFNRVQSPATFLGITEMKRVYIVEAHDELFIGETPEVVIQMVEACEARNGRRAVTIVPQPCIETQVNETTWNYEPVYDA